MTLATGNDSRTPRQRELIAAAARLFAQHGYHAVGINDISGALGLTGPAFYRHYPSKEAVLVAILDDAITTHLQEVGDLARAIPDARTALGAIIGNHVKFVFDHSADIVTWRTEFRSLPESDRHRLRYLQRLYTEEWVRALNQLRPVLDIEQIRTMCQGAISLIQSATEFTNKLTRAEQEPLLTAMALHVLLETPVEPLEPATGRAERMRTMRSDPKS
ncbi:MAG TPA: TetR/AcrR family transcriptional regulator [Sporichthyaceae bacterium]|jgi:AcrR family transcriptional regulator|nr:TetR/AcrR family transcriptional regulator [Sporichthyaceae bacterium]